MTLFDEQPQKSTPHWMRPEATLRGIMSSTKCLWDVWHEESIFGVKKGQLSSNFSATFVMGKALNWSYQSVCYTHQHARNQTHMFLERLVEKSQKRVFPLTFQGERNNFLKNQEKQPLEPSEMALEALKTPKTV